MARRVNDFYETPGDYVDSLVARVPQIDAVFDPCAGKGAISNRFRAFTSDIDPTMGTHVVGDATTRAPWNEACEVFDGAIPWTVMNPPFTPSLMVPILTLALEYSDNVITLARVSFLEPTESRREWWDEHPPDMCIVLPRYSFTGTGNDSVTCCWIGWGPQVPQLFTIETAKPSWRRRTNGKG